MNKITFVNNTSPLLSAENLNAIQDNTEDAINGVQDSVDTIETNVNALSPEIIYAKMTQDESMSSSSYTEVSHWGKQDGVGENLTISNGKILIGEGINHIRISVKMWVESTQDTLFYSYILKNSSSISGSWFVQWKQANKTIQGFNQSFTEVESGDIITINKYGDGTLMSNTTIIVEKID